MSRLSSGMMWRLCLRRTAMCKLRELLLYILLRQVPSLIKSQVEEILVALEVEV